MFWFFGKKKIEEVHSETKKGFESVKNDVEKIGTWIKHLDQQDKQLSDLIFSLKMDVSSIKEEVDGLKEAVSLLNFEGVGKQASGKRAVLDKQQAVYSVVKPVQTGVQTGNLYEILQGLSANERLVVFTIMNAEEGMKLSYEDLARLLGKERSTIRGQINAIKQKSEGLINELTEPNGKKRVFVSEEVRNKLLKYAKVRVAKGKKTRKKGDFD